MIEIHVKVRLDTNDPREAYLQVMGALAFSGHRYSVSDYWLINGQPLPKTIAKAVKGSYPERQVQELQTFVTCDECDQPLDEPHAPECGKRILQCPNVVDDDCEPELECTFIPGNGIAYVTSDWRDEFRRALRNVKPFRPQCIHNEVDVDVSEPEYTPMFRRMMSEPRVDFDFGEAPNCTTPLDFNVGTAEGLPPTDVDAEISILLRLLRQAE